MTEQADSSSTRSQLSGGLGECLNRELAADENIVDEVETYRGYAIALTDRSLLIVVGGALAGLKDAQHVLRLNIDEIVDISFEPEKLGCISPFIGPPVIRMLITPAESCTHDERWNTVIVKFMQAGHAMRIAGRVRYEQGRRQQPDS